MFEIRPMVNPTRVMFLCSAWLAALTHVVFGQASNAWVDIGVIGYAIFVALTLSRLRRDTVVILLMLVLVGWFLLDHRPKPDEWWAAGRYVLIFTALFRPWHWCERPHQPCLRCSEPSSHWRNYQHRRQPAGFRLPPISLAV